MANTTLRTITGKENHMGGSLSVEVFLLPPREIELPLWSAARMHQFNGSGLTMLGIGSRVPSIANTSEDIGGCWRINQYEVADGHILKMVVKKRASGFGNSIPKTAAIYVRARSTAAMQRITTPTLNVPHKSSRPSVEIVGRFDVVSMAEVMATGHSIPRHFAYQSTAALIAEYFTITEMEPAIEAKVETKIVEVVTPSGERKVMPVAGSRRNIKF